MLDERFVQDVCNAYNGETLVGLARNLNISSLTLWRVRTGHYATNKPYAKHERKNRLIPNICFSNVLETADRVKRGNKF